MNTVTKQAVSAEQFTQILEENQRLKQENNWFKQQLFGRKSEKRRVEHAQQPSLFDFSSSSDSLPAPKETITYQRRKTKSRNDNCVTEQGLRYDDTVPVEVIELSVPELQGKQAHQYEIIDTKVTHRLAQRPGSYVVLEYRRPVLKHKATQTLSTPAAPASVLENSITDVSLLAGLLIDKFVYHMPLYRQHQRLKQSGITVSRTSLTNWVKRAILLLKPIAHAQLQQILQSKVLAMDETPIKAGKKSRGKMKTTWFWPLYGEQHEVVFGWSQSRGSEYVKQVLKDFKGTLLTDGYAAYDCFVKDRPDITLAQCWAHTRRYFIKAQEVEPERAEQALQMIARLYKNEAHIQNKSLDNPNKLVYRSLHSKPLVDTFFNWCYEQRQRVDLMPSNPLSKAIAYVENHQAQLQVYLSDPDVPIDTNHVERTLRPIPMGKKNWLFAWSEVGAEHIGIIQTLLQTCKLQNVDPYRYLVDVLQRISIHPARQVTDLTPRLWKENYAKAPLLSELDRLEK